MILTIAENRFYGQQFPCGTAHYGFVLGPGPSEPLPRITHQQCHWPLNKKPRQLDKPSPQNAGGQNMYLFEPEV